MPYSKAERGKAAPETRQPPSLTIVVPCFNEEESLPFLLAGIDTLNAHLLDTDRISEPLTLMLVDDGSADPSAASRLVEVLPARLARLVAARQGWWASWWNEHDGMPPIRRYIGSMTHYDMRDLEHM